MHMNGVALVMVMLMQGTAFMFVASIQFIACSPCLSFAFESCNLAKGRHFLKANIFNSLI